MGLLQDINGRYSPSIQSSKRTHARTLEGRLELAGAADDGVLVRQVQNGVALGAKRHRSAAALSGLWRVRAACCCSCGGGHGHHLLLLVLWVDVFDVG